MVMLFVLQVVKSPMTQMCPVHAFARAGSNTKQASDYKRALKALLPLPESLKVKFAVAIFEKSKHSQTISIVLKGR